MDDTRVLQLFKIHHRHINQWGCSGFLERIVHFAVDLDMDGLTAVRAARFNQEAKVFFSELPLHEGRRNCVYPSSRKDFLACAEGDPVRRRLSRHRVSPGHIAFLISKKKHFPFFQIIQNCLRPFKREINAS